MGDVSTIFAPLHRAMGRLAGGSLGFPPNAAASVDFLGAAIQDHRLPYNKRGSSNVQPGILGWYGSDSPIVANLVPTAAAVANIAAAAHVVQNTAMALVGASGAGIILLSVAAPAQFFANPVVVSVGVAIENLPTVALMGKPSSGGSFATGYYNRSTCVGRVVSITSAAGAAGGHFLVSGYDTYGFPMSENINAAANATTNGKKAFKVITSVVPLFTDAQNYSVGTADIFGFGLLASFFGDVSINWNSAVVTANAGFTAADTTAPATTTTGDVRGTYAVQTASDGTKRLMLRVTPTLGSIAANPTTGLFGQPQV